MAASIVVDTAAALSEVNKALQNIKEGLYQVKVSQTDATELQRKLEGELFEKWEEGCEVMAAKNIAIANITQYLDHMQKAYEGIDADMREKMNGIHWSEDWHYKIMEFKFNKKDQSGARYGMVAFGKSADGLSVDCMYVLYKMDFKIAPQRIVTEKNHSAVFGLFQWTTHEEKIVERDLGLKSVQLLQNFFRMKALQGFYKEGVIDSINYVPSIEDVGEAVIDAQ
ncbi:uncharacterized protein LOC106154061 [Lingula anatina]|uniref:Uncharacterized protein LOC106154061 n=1 Tax=Lingula anatina TaxID=7574 RepID=A0A1S3HE15_LINAN|nr:uncharacterized protein LOC106154061 [Lingula anatina]XP_013383746.1 uncharacterized protein LOC106154061 [Lingula anatina]|eukprot:XP_013383745.1 uncharacterized protein LOC106154061 [Lingula anatina]